MYTITVASQASSAATPEGWKIGPLLLARNGKTLTAFEVAASTDWTTRFMAFAVVDSDTAADVLPDVLLQWGLARVGSEIRQGLFDELQAPADENVLPRQTREPDGEAIPGIARLVAVRACGFKHRQGGDLYCATASPNDGSMVGTLGLKGIAPTSESVCRRCGLPPDSLRCSHLGHVRVSGLEDSGGYERMVAQGFCDKGLGEQQGVVRGTDCRPFKSDCWAMIVDPTPALVEPAPVPPTAMSDALDFLDAAWRLAFKQKLLHLSDTGPATELALQCDSKDAFESRMSALANVLKSLKVDPDLLAAHHVSDVPDQGQTLQRIGALLAATSIDEPDRAAVAQVLRTLGSINRIRSAMQHSGTGSALLTAFRDLGLDVPSESYSLAWDGVRTRAVEAIRTLRKVVQMLAP
jgi:hypothetical protein